MSARYIITRHVGLPGVRLSCPGHWGNLPFDSVEDARAYVARNGGGPIEVQPIRKLRAVAP